MIESLIFKYIFVWCMAWLSSTILPAPPSTFCIVNVCAHFLEYHLFLISLDYSVWYFRLSFKNVAKTTYSTYHEEKKYVRLPNCLFPLPPPRENVIFIAKMLLQTVDRSYRKL